jgi:hypothetical protein
MSLAVYVKDIQTLAERVPLDEPETHLDKRWQGGKAREFLAAARKFVADTKFTEFLKSQQPLYDTTNARLQEFVTKADLEWYDRFLGTHSPVRFIIVPGMANGGPSYGASFVGEDGVEEMYAIPGVFQVDDKGRPQFGAEWGNTMVHEFIHSYSNPLVDKFAAKMEKAGRQINEPVQGSMRSQGYGASKTLLYESMVRASTIHYVLEHGGSDSAKRLIQEETARSFFWISDLVDVLGAYKKDRQQYPTLESFMPRVVQFFDDVAPRIGDLIARYDETRPKVVSTNISDGAQDVDPKVAEVVIRFDRPMIATRYTIARTSNDQSRFPQLGKPHFDETATICTVPITLEPDHDYEFAIGSFAASQNFAPLKQAVHFRFRTKAATGH